MLGTRLQARKSVENNTAVRRDASKNLREHKDINFSKFGKVARERVASNSNENVFQEVGGSASSKVGELSRNIVSSRSTRLNSAVMGDIEKIYSHFELREQEVRAAKSAKDRDPPKDQGHDDDVATSIVDYDDDDDKENIDPEKIATSAEVLAKKAKHFQGKACTYFRKYNEEKKLRLTQKVIKNVVILGLKEDLKHKDDQIASLEKQLSALKNTSANASAGRIHEPTSLRLLSATQSPNIELVPSPVTIVEVTQASMVPPAVSVTGTPAQADVNELETPQNKSPVQAPVPPRNSTAIAASAVPQAPSTPIAASSVAQISSIVVSKNMEFRDAPNSASSDGSAGLSVTTRPSNASSWVLTNRAFPAHTPINALPTWAKGPVVTPNIFLDTQLLNAVYKNKVNGEIGGPYKTPATPAPANWVSRQLRPRQGPTPTSRQSTSTTGNQKGPAQSKSGQTQSRTGKPAPQPNERPQIQRAANVRPSPAQSPLKLSALPTTPKEKKENAAKQKAISQATQAQRKAHQEAELERKRNAIKAAKVQKQLHIAFRKGIYNELANSTGAPQSDDVGERLISTEFIPARPTSRLPADDMQPLTRAVAKLSVGATAVTSTSTAAAVRRTTARNIGGAARAPAR
ncbi:hypothetical protein HDU76_005044 [Blyttiomyces sp. JEL0837]|nr:hypothetical protein HDU76_005044 [Blyttiomyces sp. JEL0837]